MKYPNAWIERAYFDDRPARRFDDARVEIEARTIVVEWRDGDQTVRYQGARNGQGHFLLHGEDHQDNATLHRFEHSVILEGFWKHHGDSGFWRVHLPETSAPRSL